MIRDERTRTITFKNLTEEILQPAWYCTACDEFLMTDADSSISAGALKTLKSKAALDELSAGSQQMVADMGEEDY